MEAEHAREWEMKREMETEYARERKEEATYEGVREMEAQYAREREVGCLLSHPAPLEILREQKNQRRLAGH